MKDKNNDLRNEEPNEYIRGDEVDYESTDMTMGSQTPDEDSEEITYEEDKED